MEIAADLSTGYHTLVVIEEWAGPGELELAWYADGSVGLRHLCTRPRDGLTLHVAPRLMLGEGHTLDVETLTITPSCGCGDCGLHGWVREGRWVPASPLPVAQRPRC